jgi:phage portal protein BeeE
MTNLAQALRGSTRSITTVDDYLSVLNDAYLWGGGGSGPALMQTLAGGEVEQFVETFASYSQAFTANSVIFSCEVTRMLLFSTIRFQFQALNKGRPSSLFSNPDLDLLETPWPGGTTQDLLLRMLLDADLSGNSYYTTGENGEFGELVRMRPDWVRVVLQERKTSRGKTLGYKKIGYAYWEGGLYGGDEEPLVLFPHEVCHFAPVTDPLATYRGMSWLTPVIRELQNDGLMMRHKRKFFENGATPNMVITLDAAVKFDQFQKFKALMEEDHEGVDNAYRSLFLGGGADATVVGANFRQIDFKEVQGHGELRIAAAARVPPVIAGLSKGQEGSSLNAGNFGAARRLLADMTGHPLWQNAAGSMGSLITAPGGSRLWYDARDVPILREDEKDAAEIAFLQAQTMRQLIDAGYEADSVQRAVLAGDYGLLVHSGLFSVQLQPAGAKQAIQPPVNGTASRAIEPADFAALSTALADALAARDNELKELEA